MSSSPLTFSSKDPLRSFSRIDVTCRLPLLAAGLLSARISFKLSCASMTFIGFIERLAGAS